MLTVFVQRRAPGSAPLNSRRVRQMALRMLTALGMADAELSILLVNDELMRKMNRDHRAKDRPTDVLAFPQQEPPVRGGILGDVVISLDTAHRQASARRRELPDEVRFLLAHGLLHLVGHDHAEPGEKQLMTKETRRLVRASSA